MKTYTTLLTLLLTAVPAIAQDTDDAPFVLPAGKLKTTDLIDSSGKMSCRLPSPRACWSRVRSFVVRVPGNFKNRCV